MNTFRSRLGFALICSALCLGTNNLRAAKAEQTFPLLKIGTQTFTNATVTTHSTDYVFILHAGGMANVKVATLDDDTRELLGYESERQKKEAAVTNSVSYWAKSKVAAIEPEKLEALKEAWTAHVPAEVPEKFLSMEFLALAGGVVLAVHLVFSFCCMLICRKTSSKPGFLVWLPVLQLFPLLRAAGMSPAWFLAFLVPGLNLIAQILWFVKIVQARRKSGWLVVALLLPVTNILAFLYLAFSSAAPAPEEKKTFRPIMTLEAV